MHYRLPTSVRGVERFTKGRAHCGIMCVMNVVENRVSIAIYVHIGHIRRVIFLDI
jgi:hypothetical protein